MCPLRPGAVVFRDSIETPHVAAVIAASLPALRSTYCTRRLNALHANSIHPPRRHAVCLVRQLLKVHGYGMVPFAKADGYAGGKKRVRRGYTICMR